MSEKWQEQLVAEFIGTFALVFIGAGAVVVAGPSGSGLVGVALAHGVVLAVMVSVLAHFSGAHFNPAVTLGVWVVRKITTPRAVLYVATQLVAGIVAAFALKWVLPEQLWNPPGAGESLGNTTVNVSLGMTETRAFVVEAILTFFLVIAVFGTAVDDRGPFAKTAGLTIGLVLVFDILMGGPLTGASMNPARSLGPALATGDLSEIWVYFAGPISGGVIAAGLYWSAFLWLRERVGQPPSKVPVEATHEEGLSD
ncbi:MAG TPA: MIP/aquaporin family protein [Actinomycetota bacterium]|nr:MIP/aquaporin family protein [Actinomycetota bacterium]